MKIVCFFLFYILWLSGFYYQSDFTSAPPDWVLMHYYGRSGIIPIPDNANHNWTTGGLSFTGQVYDGANDYNTFWSGLNAKFNVEFSASPYKPFGAMIHRTYARVDGFGSQNNLWQFAGLTYWMIQENDISGDFEAHNEVVMFYEVNQCDTPSSKFGLFRGTPQNFDLGAVERPNGTSLNLTNDSIFSWEWNHDNDQGGEGNTNHLQIMMTHDGRSVKLYLNPDPLDINGYPNEFCLAGQVAVSFTNRIKIMVGQEANMAYTDREDATYSNFLIRSVTKGSTGRLLPAPGGGTLIRLSFHFRQTDAGVGEVQFRPAQPEGQAPDIKFLSLTSSSGQPQRPLSIIKTNSPPAAGEAGFFYRKREGHYVLRLFKGTKSSPDFIPCPGGTYNGIDMIVDHSPDEVLKKWQIMVDNRLYDSDGHRSYATTGSQKVRIIRDDNLAAFGGTP